MYPEGWLIAPGGRSLLFFEKDPMNPIHEGYIGLWVVDGVGSKQFRYKKRTYAAKALDQWSHLSKLGWRVVEERDQAA
ncbi:DUF1651 domain-containing protein [Prochlorococcus sp. MIT 1307]|uniref:DUF1651 domain-containing protein n=1 Tax=Prochlorococcus sp. MIT 1307 TaxID=3096219 RepID=UPI002A748535|nr:DUF1651 domain-containing protein [Prochlorococcus sp. MIT 1307]